MIAVHLTIAGFAEAALTGLAVAYLLRTHPALFENEIVETGAKGGLRLAAAIVPLMVLVPLGLLAPGGADFEWGAEELQQLVGYIPSGVGEMGELWRWAPLKDYQLPGLGPNASLIEQAPAYLLSVVVGVGLIFALFLTLRIALRRVVPQHN